MNTNDMVNEILNSGVTPLELTYDKVHSFDSNRSILRSKLIVNSLDLGVLTFGQYRYVARRNKLGERLNERHIKKLLEAFPQITSSNKADCVTVPIFPKVFLSGRAAEIIFDAFSEYPSISKAQVCVELSADLLFEDIELVKQRLTELRELGVKTSFFELGDDFCPIFRLQGLPLNYVFADDSYLSKLTDRDEIESAKGLPDFLHLHGIKAFCPATADENQIKLAQAAGFDGYGEITDAETLNEEEEA